MPISFLFDDCYRVFEIENLINIIQLILSVVAKNPDLENIWVGLKNKFSLGLILNSKI